MRRAWTGLLRWLRRPWAAVVLLALLGLSVWVRPGWMNKGWSQAWRSASREPTANPRDARKTILRAVDNPGYFDSHVSYLVRPSDETRARLADGHPPDDFRLIDVEAESWDEMSKIVVDRPADVIECSLDYGQGLEGLFGATRRVTYGNVRMQLWTATNTFTKKDIQEARRIYVEWITRYRERLGVLFTDEEWAELKNGPVGRVEHLWMGYAHNLLTAPALVVLVYSASVGLVPWLVRLPWTLRAWRQERRIGRGECPRCRYAIAGLTEKKCPECGEEWRTGDRGQKEVAEVRVVDAREIIGEGKKE